MEQLGTLCGHGDQFLGFAYVRLNDVAYVDTELLSRQLQCFVFSQLLPSENGQAIDLLASQSHQPPLFL